MDDIKKTQEKMVVVFELSNTQKDFAVCGKIMQAIEKDLVLADTEIAYINKNYQVKWGKLPENNKKSGIEGNNVKAKFVENIERFLYEEKSLEKKIFRKYYVGKEEKQVRRIENVYYYIHINMDNNSDIVSLQYLFTMIQGLGKVAEKIVCFFAPFNDYFSKAEGDFSLYYKLSHYLRFIKHNNLFGVFSLNSREIKIAHLSGKKVGVQETFIPLIEVNEETYKVFSQNILEETYVDSDLVYELKEISNKVINKRFKNKKDNEQIKASLNKYMEVEMRYTLLEYLLFACLFSKRDNEKVDEKIQIYLYMIKEMAEGMFQLMENIIQHSMLKKGLFTFRIHGKDRKCILHETIGMQESALNFLEVGLIDYNDKETIIDNFFNKENVKKESIFKYRGNVRVNHFLNIYEDSTQSITEFAWSEYRKKYPLHCMGLPKLANNLKKYGAFLFMKSSTEFSVSNHNLTYSKNFSSNSLDDVIKLNKHFIPGTQYRIIFPIKEIEVKNYNADRCTNLIGDLKENDETYAQFFNYIPEEILDFRKVEWIDECNRIYQKNTETAKNEAVEFWIEKINLEYEKVEEKQEKLFYIDVKLLCEKGQIWTLETFCKGLVGSKICHKDGLKYLAMIHCSEDFFQIFYTTFMLGKEENNLIQIYLVGKSVEKELLISGKTDMQIRRNIAQYMFMRGIVTAEYDNLNWDSETQQSKEDIAPYDVIIKSDIKEQKSIFDKYIECIACAELTDYARAGYKISNTHMRLGSKVHLGAFYEIAILLQKPRVARKIAFQILRDLVEETNFHILNDKVLFYGYASYSRVILESIMEIAASLKKVEYARQQQEGFKPCRLNLLDSDTLKWGFAVYQNDIIVQKPINRLGSVENIYFSSRYVRDNLNDYKIIQIVPISSTLTTFNKMCSELKTEMGRHAVILDESKIINNYTVFWVRDSSGMEMKPSEIEEKYWSEILDERTIKTDLISPNPKFFCMGKSKWQDPLMCEWCYPTNVLDEKALIETDSTSTVPTLQLEKPKADLAVIEDKENSVRVIRLKNALKYGHIQRDNNHFMYYIDTNEYFILEKKEVKDWIQKLQRPDKKRKLNIIVSPQHHTNVEFCHYVNNYYFDGVADIISFDATKEYKSNIQAKYADVKVSIQQAVKMNIDISFTYVDDTIITGTTFRRVNNLIHTLLPEEMRKTVQIDEIFVLLNRLSTSSKRAYVENPDKYFHSYVDLNISSIRNYGTSCVMCGLERDSNLFKRRASTKCLSEYWNKKEYDYRAHSFDSDYSEIDNNKGYYRMLCSHYAAEMFEEDETETETILKIIKLFTDLKVAKTHQSPIYSHVFSEDILLTIKSFLKVLCRPFFSYGKNFRQCMLDFLLVLTECFINIGFAHNLVENVQITTNKSYLNDREVREKFNDLFQFIQENLNENNKIEFVQDYLLESLTDLKSNYIIRRNTLKHICIFLDDLVKEKRIQKEELDCFFNDYQINVHRLVNSSTDETKTLWLEYLLITGEEYPKNNTEQNILKSVDIKVAFGNGVSEMVYDTFACFWEEMYLENTRLYYDGTMRFVDRMRDNKTGVAESIVEQLWKDYYIKNLITLIKINSLLSAQSEIMPEEDIKKQISIMVDFLAYIKQARREGINKYVQVSEKMKALLQTTNNLSIIIGECEQETENEFYDISQKDDKPINENILDNIKEAVKKGELKKTGYFIAESHVVIQLENNYRYLLEQKIEDIQEKQIAPVYVYIETREEEDDRRKVLAMIRKVLMFRNQLLKLFAVDFNNNSMHVLAKQKIRSQQLVRDKAGDHSSRSDINAMEYVLQYQECEEDSYDEIRKWLLLRAYVNIRIARLFRWHWNDHKGTEYVYVKKEYGSYWYKALENLGDCIFDEKYDKNHTNLIDENIRPVISPRNYFRLLDNLFEIEYDIYNYKGTAYSFLEMEKPLRKLECVEVKGLYYRSEFIICILLDICFSAIHNSKPWDRLLMKEVLHVDTVKQYEFIKRNITEKCYLSIYTEKCQTKKGIYYLVFKNKKYFNDDKSIEEYNENLLKKVKNNSTEGGFSLSTIIQYIEGIWENKAEKVSVQFYYDNIEGENYFFIKLPILRRDDYE